MSLYVRLQSSFWTHRKTLRLRVLIGEPAFWLPPRLWSYAAENQPDGDFSDYLPEELALLLAYSGDAQAMLQALQQARFLDGMRIHDWQEHNGYHATFSTRAQTAARARWKGKERIRKDKKGKDTSIASSITLSNTDRCLSDFSVFLRETFQRWIAFRKGLGKKPKDWDAMFSEQATWIKQFPEKEAVEILSASIRNGWQGLFPPKQAHSNEGLPRPKTKFDLEYEEFQAKKKAKEQNG
jgi:hypothetical protein